MLRRWSSCLRGRGKAEETLDDATSSCRTVHACTHCAWLVTWPLVQLSADGMACLQHGCLPARTGSTHGVGRERAVNEATSPTSTKDLQLSEANIVCGPAPELKGDVTRAREGLAAAHLHAEAARGAAAVRGGAVSGCRGGRRLRWGGCVARTHVAAGRVVELSVAAEPDGQVAGVGHRPASRLGPDQHTCHQAINPSTIAGQALRALCAAWLTACGPLQ